MNVRKTAMSITTVMMVLAIFGVAGAMAAGQDDYGTKVAMCDVDNTYRLNPLPAAQQIMYVDTGPGGYEQGDEVYLDVDGVLVGGVAYVSPLDIRLTPAADAGSQVQVGDGDVGDALIAPPSGRGGVLDVMYWDMPRSSPGGGMPFVNGLYDLSEPVYIDMDGGGFISINDVRVTQYSGCLPGAKVLGSDVDVTTGPNALIAMPYAWDLPKCRYYDTDGNGNYNAGDHVIFDARITILAPPPFGLGSVNDIRLTPLVGCGVTYAYGTKITESRIDAVHVLGTPNQNAPFQLGYWDVTGNGYTSGDPVYIDVNAGMPLDGSGISSPGDVRLTPYGPNGAGSQMILATDPDMGMPLTFIPLDWVDFLDMTGDGYTPDDPVYVDMGNDWIVSVNDVILSEGTASAGTPGSKVVPGSPYLNRQLTDFVTTIPGGININYFDANGDGWYQNIIVGPLPLALGIGDYVFLDVGRQGYSSANDVRLTEPTFTYPFGSKVGPTEDCCVDGLATFPMPFGPANTRLMSWDITGGGFSDDDPVYLDTSNTFMGVWQVEAHDVRLTPLDHGATHYNAGTAVKPGELDEFHTTNFIPWNRIRYYDIGVAGYTPGDPVIIDQDDNYIISPLDVRLTPYNNFAAGSKVKVSDNDPYWHQPLIILTAVQAGWFDVDDRAYDGKDYVYLDIFADSFVTVNDVRLTGREGPPCPEDLNHDGFINFGDVLVLIPLWGQACSCPEDLNHDGIINFGDVLVLIPLWGQACP